MNNDTMIYPLSDDAQSKLLQLMFFGKISKIAIVQSDCNPPFLLVDHTEYVRGDEPTIDGSPNITEEKRRTAIMFNYSKDEDKYDAFRRSNMCRGKIDQFNCFNKNVPSLSNKICKVWCGDDICKKP